ncbi:MAG: hypothetical protein JWM11_2223 [Planctomycetaceae bacterium]|nr:hypothetical protein [Planctomycetaceae bacterium]
MAADYVNTLSLVRNAISLGTPIIEAWEAVIGHISSVFGTDASFHLRALNVAEDYRQLELWLLDLLEASPPAKAIRGLRFGLFHPESEGRPSCDIYLSGSPSFDQDGDEWADESNYKPETHPHSRILDALYLVSAEPRFEKQEAVVHLCLWFALLSVAELCRRNSASIRGGASRRGIGVGFDGGDLINLGVHSKSGFTPLRPEKKKGPPRRRKLLPGEYFKLEGGRESLMYQCTDRALSRKLLKSFERIESVSLTAKIDPDWLNQCGKFGTLYPFYVHFMLASVAQQIEAVFPDEVQFHELNLVGSSEEWRVMQVLQNVECFDRETSDRKQHLTLFRNIAAGHNIFFVAGYSEGQYVLVSRSAAQLLIDQGVMGAAFVPVGTN